MEKTNSERDKLSTSRRDFLKFGGAAAAAAGSVGLAAGTGFVLGRDPDADLGWGRTAAGEDMFFNREAFAVEKAPTLNLVSTPRRPEREEFLFRRMEMMYKAIKDGWNPEDGYESCPDARVVNYYRMWPERYKDILDALKHRKVSAAEQHKYVDRYAISHAYDYANKVSMYGKNGVKINWPLPPKGEPEIADFKSVGGGKTDGRAHTSGASDAKKRKFKSPAHASELIKKVSHQFGCSFVGIAKLDPNFVFKNLMYGMPDKGANWGDRIPKHWKSVIVLGQPMSWDGMYAGAAYGTSYEGYSVVRHAAGKLEVFLNRLGYAGRAMVPGGDYEVTLPPIAAQAGLGELSRSGTLLMPEVGTNVRLACVVTDLDFEYDKPIDFGVSSFCNSCKICADYCPSGSISKADEPDAIVRGYKVFNFNQDSCYGMWSKLPTNGQQGCRICIAVCPYTRRNNWIHALAKVVEPRDPTGMVKNTMLAMQKNFFYYPDAEDYHAPHNGGKLAGYHQPPKWLRAEEYFSDVDKNWDYVGNWEGL